MKRKQALSILLCLALIVGIAIPGTLAMENEATTAVTEPSTETTAPVSEPAVPATTAPTEPAVTEAPTEPTRSTEATNPTEPTEVTEATDPTETTEATEPTTEPTDPTGEATEPTEPIAHIEGCSDECTVEGCTCPCHEKKPVHIEGCSDECDGTDCECVCHLFDRLMACETLQELMEMIEATPEEALMTLTEEQVAQVEEKILALHPQPLPEIIIEETDDAPVASEIFYPTVNFDNVAPFGKPVVG